MSWRDVLTLLKQAGGDMDKVQPARLKTATQRGPGDADTQIVIARREYERQSRKDSDNGQEEWYFA